MHTAELRIGSMLDARYRVVRLLGSGGMSRVYLADDTQLGRPVAVKVFGHRVADDDGARQRDEARLLAGLSHPGLVVLFDARLDEDPPFLIMEYVAGSSLHDRLGRGRLSVAEGTAIMKDAAGALAFVHDRGVIHRDIKPANILLPDGGPVHAKLADFGIARLLAAESVTATGTVMGTAAYISPEQASAGVIGTPSDVYSLGLVFIELLTGARAFAGTAVETAAARLASDPDLTAPELAPYRSLLAAMTARAPTARPSADDVAADLEGASRTRALPPPTRPLTTTATTATEVIADPASPTDHATRPRRRVGPIIATSVAAVVLGAAIVASIISWSALSVGSSPTTDDPTDAPRSEPIAKVMPQNTEAPTDTPPGHQPGHGKDKKDPKPGKGP